MPEPINPATRTPNEQLADKIVAKFGDEQLIPTAKRNEILAKLATGAATESDWKLWLDLPLMKREAGR